MSSKVELTFIELRHEIDEGVILPNAARLLITAWNPRQCILQFLELFVRVGVLGNRISEDSLPHGLMSDLLQFVIPPRRDYTITFDEFTTSK